MKAKMNFFTYLLDRGFVLLGWLAFYGLTLLLVWIYPKLSVSWDFAVYLFLLEFFMMSFFLAWDYGRKRQYYQELIMLAKERTPEQIFKNIHTNEQHLVEVTIAALIERQQLELNQVIQRQQEQRDFLNSWVHEIKVPLAALNLLQQAIADDIPEARYYQMENEVGHINDYVEQVLYYARLDAFSQDYLIQETSLADLAHEAVKNFANYFIMKHLQLQFVGADFTVLTDAKWFVFILRQIIANAIKYTPDNGKITIELFQADGKRGIRITDTGVGIPPADLPRIFDQGFTGSNGRNLEQKSTGLGLYLAKNLAQKLGHALDVSSILAVGTTVTIYLPELNFYDYQPSFL